MLIQKYDKSLLTLWNSFVQVSKNGTFLFQREYMDYHQNRFQDHSLVIFDDNLNVVALLPANKHGSKVVSHEGLTYGGFIVDITMKLPKLLEIFDTTLTYLKQQNVTELMYRTVPYIYHSFPAEEDRYALFLCNAKVIRRGVLTVVSGRNRMPFQKRRSRGVKKAISAGLSIRRCYDFNVYWQLLTETLQRTYNTQPVHSLEEISLLVSLFPDNIKLFGCFEQDVLVAGVVLYESANVAHVQYIASSERGRNVGGLDILFFYLIEEVYINKPFFDFGTSDENDGYSLNTGLIDQKEGFGARVIVHDHYIIHLDSWQPNTITGVLS